MSTNNPTVALPSPVQIGVIVKDIEETAKFLSSIWGLGPWDTKELTYTKDNLAVGEPFKIKVAYAKLGEIILELIQPIEGNSIFSEFLMTKGEGLFNINFHVSNYDEIISKLREYQNKMILEIIKQKRYGYWETRPGGIVIEFAEV